MKTSPVFLDAVTGTASEGDGGEAPTPQRRINPWRQFIGAMIPNWLLRRKEISNGAKLLYGRLAQYAGQDGHCFPRQKTLATELGVCERIVRKYLGELEQFKLIESVQNGLCRPNNYFFLNHPWMADYLPGCGPSAVSDRKTGAIVDRQPGSVHDRHDAAIPTDNENPSNEDQGMRPTPCSPPKGDSLPEQSCNLSEAEQLLAVYPKQAARPAALRAINRALKRHSFDYLLERTKLFASTCDAPLEFMPKPARLRTSLHLRRGRHRKGVP